MLTITLTENLSTRVQAQMYNLTLFHFDPFSTSRFKNSGDDYFFGAIR
jgi:hypothetical protein